MYRIERGGAAGAARVGTALRARCDREMHTALIRATDGLTHQPSGGWYDMRRGRERWWGNLCRRIAELHASGVPKERVELIPAVLQAYIDELYESDTQAEPSRAA